ncbi:signal peptide peptidase SppA [Thalassotalea litorea]|uniref:Signal peptide peptidase SppA n=1 Tax=Thalassotalea litorea TaxID=2020715 RepID=A0A5R9INL4_9GAMM|nr:signal peptide peptidase SppA [Thalassotalea litorea]TLU66169.1 signal peptide peptidase SppA [Thalassotalea litorea]
MSDKPGIFKRIFSKLWKIINTSRIIFLNLVFFLFVIIFFSALFDDSDKVEVPETAALLLNLKGDLVEQKRYVDPMDKLLSESLGQEEERPEILVSDVINVLETAKNDDRIQTLVIYPQNLMSAGLHHLQLIGQAITDFKESGKEVVSFGDYYSQGQYYLAASADKVWMNPNGMMLLEGFGRYRVYFKEALDKLKITQHVFKVGTYKSAVEPYIRDDMSDAAKEANKAWLDQLWSNYKRDIANFRDLDANEFDEKAGQLLEKLEQSEGSFAEYALRAGFVDELRTREEIRKDMIERVGKSENHASFRQINFKDYLKATKNPFPVENPASDKVAVVVAKGTILNGHQKPGTIGGDSTAKLLRKARLNKQVKAVVLRVDSPGGSAFASELIRQEVELLKAAGKPVVASMANYAASGGYWISASANEIWASENTITGSIGIFGMFMTFEKSLAEIGVHTDGIGTTDFAGLSPTQKLNPQIGAIIQTSIDRGYQDFLTLVAENRDMTTEEVDKIAQGRVWTGAKAKELGLVDELGNLDDAVAAAAKLASLKQYDTKLIERELSPKDLFLQNLLDNAQAFLPEASADQSFEGNQALQNVINQLMIEFERVNQLNDPKGIYSFCLTCEIN